MTLTETLLIISLTVNITLIGALIQIGIWYLIFKNNKNKKENK